MLELLVLAGRWVLAQFRHKHHLKFVPRNFLIFAPFRRFLVTLFASPGVPLDAPGPRIDVMI